jgi:arylsulfatase I/J
VLDANTVPESFNGNDTVSGYAGIPRNMTTIALHMKVAGYRTHFVGKWDAGM